MGSCKRKRLHYRTALCPASVVRKSALYRAAERVSCEAATLLQRSGEDQEIDSGEAVAFLDRTRRRLDRALKKEDGAGA